MKNLSPVLSGVAGEYFAAGELSRLGYIASITLRNSKGVDILASNETASKTIGIQVKTHQGKGEMWVLNEKAEEYSAKNLFYVFVSLNNGEIPEFFVVPSKVVARFAKMNHRKWRTTLRRDGKKHKSNSMRKFRDDKRQYLNRWDLLGLDK